MKIKDFTVGQVVYAFSYEDIALLKGLKPKKYTVAKNWAEIPVCS